MSLRCCLFTARCVVSSGSEKPGWWNGCCQRVTQEHLPAGLHDSEQFDLVEKPVDGQAHWDSW